MISAVRSVEACNAFYHFSHQQCFLLVTKAGHNPIFASHVFLTSFSLLASGNFVSSVLRSFKAFDAFYHFIHQHCCLLVTKDGHNPIFASQVFSRWHRSHSLLLATSRIVVYEVLKRILLFTASLSTLFFVSRQRWSQPSSSHCNFSILIFFCSPLLTTSWILFCKTPKCVMLLTTFASTVLSVGHQRWSKSYLRIASFFSLTSFAQFASSKFVISVLRSFDAFNAFYHFIHQQCCLLVTKDSHNPIFASQVFSRWHLSHSLLLANSWILIMKTPWFVMLSTTFPSTVLSVGHQ